MARVEIKNEGISFELPDGSALLPYAKKHSSIPFGCEKGECGMCACVILSGEENVNQKSLKEIETLARIGAPSSPKNRLACQLRINGGEVVLEY